MIELELKIGNEENFNRGAFSVVIFDREKGFATKVFHPFKEKRPEFIEKVFKSEVDAYRKIWEDKGEINQLQKITPKFHGVVEEPIKITHDLKQNYYRDIPPEFTSRLAFKMEYVNSCFKKLGSGDSNFINLIEDRLHANGFQQNSIIKVFCAHNLWALDACIAIDGGKIWVIDFATEDWDNFKE